MKHISVREGFRYGGRLLMCPLMFELLFRLVRFPTYEELYEKR